MVETSATGTAVLKKLLAAQRAVGSIIKESYNQHGKHSYASVDQFVEQAKRALNDAGLIVTASDELKNPWLDAAERLGACGINSTTLQAMLTNAWFVRTTLRVIDPETGELLTFFGSAPAAERAGMLLDKAIGAASSYALKYALRGALCAARHEDDPSRRDDPDARDDSAYRAAPGSAPKTKTTTPKPGPKKAAEDAQLAELQRLKVGIGPDTAYAIARPFTRHEDRLRLLRACSADKSLIDKVLRLRELQDSLKDERLAAMYADETLVSHADFDLAISAYQAGPPQQSREPDND